MPYEVIRLPKRDPLFDVDDLELKCALHPSIPLACCSCQTHKKTGYKQTKAPRLEMDARTGAINRQSFLVDGHYQLTICGSCGIVATDHRTQRQAEYTMHFRLTIYTWKCKHCGIKLTKQTKRDDCPALQDGSHERRIIVRSRLIAVCADCHKQGTIEAIDDTDYSTRPEEYVRLWASRLREEGITIQLYDPAKPQGRPLQDLRGSNDPKPRKAATAGSVTKRSDAWEQLVSAPWGDMSAEGREKVRQALTAYKRG